MAFPRLRDAWFLDDKSGCEKQTNFFTRYKIMHDQLLTTEEENLTSAVDRFNSFTYPKRRPVVIHNVRKRMPAGYYGQSTQHYNNGWNHFLDRHLHESQSALQFFEKRRGEMREITTRSLGREVSRSHRHNQYERQPSHLPILHDKEVAQILSSVEDSPGKSFSNYVTRDHLPSIPNVGHKSSIVAENRLKVLLSEDEYSETPAIKTKTSQGSNKYMEIMLYPEKKRLHGSTESTRKKTSSSLKFDIDPNDGDIFKHTGEKKELDEENMEDPILMCNEKTKPAATILLPCPPPNSRPESMCNSLIKIPEIVCDVDETGECSETDPNSPGELNVAMEQLMHAHNEYEQLKNELIDIVDHEDT